MDKNQRALLLVIGFGAIGIASVLAYLFAPLPNQGARDAAGALALIGAAAVAIERVIEMMWTALGSFVGDWWPLSIVKREVELLENDLDPVVAKFYTDAKKGLDLAQELGQLTTDQLTAAKGELDKQQASLNAQLTKLRGMAPDSQRAQVLSVTVGQGIALVASKYADFSDDVQRAVNEAQQSVTAVSDFVATFKDNPGKRLISIWAGMLLGLGAAGFLGLDVFVAALGPDVPAGTPMPADPAGIVMTGLVIGLGAGPTHEVIRVLQEIKKARKTENHPAV